MTVAEARAILRPMGWRLTGTRREGYVLVSLPDFGDMSTGPFDSPAEAVDEARRMAQG